ncbi:MAG: hypothetical protein KAS32_00755, partial [Candidatus Peribacteraceae bacterium]|nr:hypothetical protein [Candidatus Peribacteraceae bacterium]
MAKKSYTVAKEELAKETAFYQVNSSSVRDPEYPEDYYKNIEEIARDYKVDYDAVKESVNRIVEAKYQQL